jgi:G3E family GTPase
VAFADRILLNKTDLVSEEELAAIQTRIKSINGAVTIHPTLNSVVDLDKILNIKAFDLQRILASDPSFLVDQDHQHDKTVGSVGILLEGLMNIHVFQEFVQEMLREKGTDLFRYKGVLSVAGMKEKFVFQGVHMIFSGDWSPVEVGANTNKFVFIGRNLDRETLVKGFSNCLAKPLRFDVGASVQANTESGWVPATVKAHWDEGNAYRITTKAGVDVWAPVDSSDFVKEIDAAAAS